MNHKSHLQLKVRIYDNDVLVHCTCTRYDSVYCTIYKFGNSFETSRNLISRAQQHATTHAHLNSEYSNKKPNSAILIQT